MVDGQNTVVTTGLIHGFTNHAAITAGKVVTCVDVVTDAWVDFAVVTGHLIPSPLSTSSQP